MKIMAARKGDVAIVCRLLTHSKIAIFGSVYLLKKANVSSTKH